MHKKVYLKNFGCQMNVRDSEVICGLLKKEGHKIIEEPKNADIVILNTCSVRQHAENKVWSEIGKLAKQRTKMGTTVKKCGQTIFLPIIGLVGCMAQNYKERAFERMPAVDFVVGPSDIEKIPQIIKKLSTSGHSLSTRNLLERKIWETDGSIRPEEVYFTGFYQDREHVYIVISEGCSNYCSYCIVPYVRGPLHDRGHKDILKEIKMAVDNGIKRVTLLGQNVCAYNPGRRERGAECRKEVDFVRLLYMVNEIKELEEFSFVTSHPKDTPVDLFRAMAELKKLRKYLHLPVQSGSDRVLQLMNRGYSREYYFDLVDKYRKIVKNGALTTDIIVGFPGENEDDFKDTYELVKRIEFNAAFIFKYSPRPNTRAEGLKDDVPREEKERRHRVILELQKEISKRKKC
ncbi:MAG: tRNA (N6-isopentenyl adenosine(37)-C2)-methylthiotransferase MiaB [Candidatus Omnitrophica bacterium]|nr:tRNA (N6-isopentenyl adenosine(37)-C2)-methylthiotransferase MiaB [Candidatus Omnitrophota bacterium]